MYDSISSNDASAMRELCIICYLATAMEPKCVANIAASENSRDQSLSSLRSVYWGSGAAECQPHYFSTCLQCLNGNVIFIVCQCVGREQLQLVLLGVR